MTHADWHEHQQLLRVLFPLDIRTSEATFDIQYGNVKRPTYENTSWDMQNLRPLPISGPIIPRPAMASA